METTSIACFTVPEDSTSGFKAEKHLRAGFDRIIKTIQARSGARGGIEETIAPVGAC